MDTKYEEMVWRMGYMTLASYTSIYSIAKEVFQLIQPYHNLLKMWRLLFYILYYTCYTKLWNHCFLRHSSVHPFIQHPHDCLNTSYLTFSLMWDDTMVYKRQTHVDYAYFPLNKFVSMSMTLRCNVLLLTTFEFLSVYCLDPSIYIFLLTVTICIVDCNTDY